jgi:hypothetical protein
MDAPNPPSGNSNEAAWLRRLRGFCISLRILPGNGYKVRRTTLGTILEILPGAGGGKKAAGMNYKGTFSRTVSYAVGDVVRQQNAQWSLGVFICVQANPVSDVTGLNIPPSYPEPFTTTGGVVANTWELLNLGVKTYQGCKGGVTKQVYVNLNEI